MDSRLCFVHPAVRLGVILALLIHLCAVLASSKQGIISLGTAKGLVSEAKAYCYDQLLAADAHSRDVVHDRQLAALGDCAKLYEEAEPRLDQIMAAQDAGDAGIWLSSVLTSHKTCLEGLEHSGAHAIHFPRLAALNFTHVFTDELAFFYSNTQNSTYAYASTNERDEFRGALRSWEPAKSEADIVVAKDGSGMHKTIKAAVEHLSSKLKEEGTSTRRIIVYIKAGVYSEKVEIRRKLKNVMFVGDGIGKTVITGNKNYVDGYTTLSSATFDVSGDGFWARDITFENTAGPEKHQAVAIRVSSDRSVFFRCSFRGYQDTLYAHSNRHFYRDCIISGTVDFIFGNAAAVFQNCDILVRRPMSHQSNMVTAHARDDPREPTGFSIHASRVRPGPDLAPVVGSFKSFLGRPWKQYSRVVVWGCDLDGVIDPRGWTQWDGSFALATLFYGEYRNAGDGADTQSRVRWPGFHVLKTDADVRPFTVKNLLDGQGWIPATGVPVSMDI